MVATTIPDAKALLSIGKQCEHKIKTGKFVGGVMWWSPQKNLVLELCSTKVQNKLDMRCPILELSSMSIADLQNPINVRVAA